MIWSSCIVWRSESSSSCRCLTVCLFCGGGWELRIMAVTRTEGQEEINLSLSFFLLLMESAMKKQEDHNANPTVNFTSSRDFKYSIGFTMKETFFPDDPFRGMRDEKSKLKKTWQMLKYFMPILEWGAKYDLTKFRYDLLAGVTVSSLAIPQGISYARLANLPPIIGLYSTFVPPLIYTFFGSSLNVSVGTIAAGSIILASMIGEEVSAAKEPELYLHLFYTAAFFSGLFQIALGVFRLGIFIDFLSRSTVTGFMGGTSFVIILQQLKGLLGLNDFTEKTDIVAVMQSVFSQTDKWRWETAVLGAGLLCILFSARHLKNKKPRLFWVSAMAPLLVVILGGVIAYLCHGEVHGIAIIGPLKKGINPWSGSDLVFQSKYLAATMKAGLVSGFLALAEGIAVARSLAVKTNENIDGNKEMIAYGMTNIAGSFTSCYVTTGAFSKTAVSYDAGCKTPFSNVVSSVCVLLTLLLLAPFFSHTPLVALSAIIIGAMIGLIEYKEAYRLYNVDKFDFLICMAGFFGVIFATMDVGLLISVSMSMLRALLAVARPITYKLGKLQNSAIYRDVEQYPDCCTISSTLILQIGSSINFANANYLRDRIMRWVEEEVTIARGKGDHLRYLILDIGGVTSIDNNGIEILHEVHRLLERKEIKMVLTDPRIEVMKKLVASNILDKIGTDWVFLSINDAVVASQFALHQSIQKA